MKHVTWVKNFRNLIYMSFDQVLNNSKYMSPNQVVNNSKIEKKHLLKKT